jgi:hypothetical protein
MKKDYKIGDVVSIDDVNKVKNALFRKEFHAEGYPSGAYRTWDAHKKHILKRVKFKIIEIEGL